MDRTAVRDNTVASSRKVYVAPSWKRLALRSVWLLSYPAALLQVRLMESNPSLTESIYSTRIFPVLRNTVASIFSSLPFSVAEFLLYLLIITLCGWGGMCIVLSWRKKLELRRFVSQVLTIFIAAGIGCNAFYWLWGFNYYRDDIAARLNIWEEEALSVAELKRLCFWLADTARELREQLNEDEQGIFVYDVNNVGILEKIPAAYERLAEIEPAFNERATMPKAVLSSYLLSNAGIAGIFIPFTEEANVNIDATPLLIAASAAHESAHYLGIAKEGEANLTAFLACAASDDPQIQYSGYMLALIHAGNALAKSDPAGYSDLWEHYSEGMKRDLDANNSYVKQNEGDVSETANRLNDNYLKSNSQSSGVLSYGEMVDLLGAYLKDRMSTDSLG